MTQLVLDDALLGEIIVSAIFHADDSPVDVRRESRLIPALDRDELDRMLVEICDAIRFGHDKHATSALRFK
jgi:hypothetical protein